MSELIWREIVVTCSSVMEILFHDARKKGWFCLFIYSISFVFNNGFCFIPGVRKFLFVT